MCEEKIDNLKCLSAREGHNVNESFSICQNTYVTNVIVQRSPVFIWWVTRHLAANQQMNWLADMKFNSHHTTCHKLTYGYDFWILFSRPIFCTSRKLPMSAPIVSSTQNQLRSIDGSIFQMLCVVFFYLRLTNVYFHIWNDYLLLLCVFISMFRTFWWQKPQKYLTALNDKLLCQFFCDSIFFSEKK